MCLYLPGKIIILWQSVHIFLRFTTTTPTLMNSSIYIYTCATVTFIIRIRNIARHRVSGCRDLNFLLYKVHCLDCVIHTSVGCLPFVADQPFFQLYFEALSSVFSTTLGVWKGTNRNLC